MSQVTPARIMQAATAYHLSAALHTGVELGLFTAIGAGHTTVPALAEHCHASQKGIRILCDYLAMTGFLTKSVADNRYGLAEDTAVFLDRSSPAYFGGVVHMMVGSDMHKVYADLTTIVRKGGTTLNDQGGSVSPENPVWEDFARSMIAMMMPSAEGIAKVLNAPEGKPAKVLDIAAGHGLFGITIARQNPNATIHAVDWPSVLEIAREHAIAAGVVDRWHTIEGSAFEVEFGTDYDVVLITNFHHHFNPQTIEGLMRKVHGALKPDGVVITLEFVPNDDRISPPDAAFFPLIMLATTAEGDAYTFAEFDQMYRNCGFSRNEMHWPPGAPQAIIVSRR
jgi:ubiquinone/menaquinone biosynthesis C-methylase UbiE